MLLSSKCSLRFHCFTMLIRLFPLHGRCPFWSWFLSWEKMYFFVIRSGSTRVPLGNNAFDSHYCGHISGVPGCFWLISEAWFSCYLLDFWSMFSPRLLVLEDKASLSITDIDSDAMPGLFRLASFLLLNWDGSIRRKQGFLSSPR